MANLGKKYGPTNSEQNRVENTGFSDLFRDEQAALQALQAKRQPDSVQDEANEAAADLRRTNRPVQTEAVHREPMQSPAYRSTDNRSSSMQSGEPFGETDKMCGVFRTEANELGQSGKSAVRSVAQIASRNSSLQNRVRDFLQRLPALWWLHLIMILLTVGFAVVIIQNLDDVMALIAYSIFHIILVLLVIGCIGLAIYFVTHRRRR